MVLTAQRLQSCIQHDMHHNTITVAQFSFKLYINSKVENCIISCSETCMVEHIYNDRVRSAGP